ncbi:MAG: hypothetical protein WA001_04470 [Patescibacteria group bacterium]
MKLNYFVFCDAAARTTQGKAVLHGVFDEAFVPQELSEEHPLVFPAMTAAFEVKDVNQKHSTVTLSITHVGTGKVILTDVLQNPKPEEETKVIGGMRQIWMLNFPALGKYKAVLAIDDVPFAETTLTISRMPTN